MARMFTVWTALKAFGCGASSAAADLDCTDALLPMADITFTRGKSYLSFPNASVTGWQTLVGGRVLMPRKRYGTTKVRWCAYDKLLLLPYAPMLMNEKGVFFDPDSKDNADKLWSISFGRHLACTGSEAGHVWRTFVRDMLTRMRLRHMLWPTHFLAPQQQTQPADPLAARTGTAICLLLRTDPSKPAGPSSSWRRSQRALPRHEAPGCVEEVHLTLGAVCRGHERLQTRNILFQHGSSLRDQVAQMAGCSVVMGIHGAQLMNIMWMQPGNAVVEFHHIAKPTSNSSKVEHLEMSYYYRNVAMLSSLTYFSRIVCDNTSHIFDPSLPKFSHCAGEAKKDGVHLYADAVRQVAMAAVAAVGHAGGAYDDRPVRECARRVKAG